MDGTRASGWGSDSRPEVPSSPWEARGPAATPRWPWHGDTHGCGETADSSGRVPNRGGRHPQRQTSAFPVPSGCRSPYLQRQRPSNDRTVGNAQVQQVTLAGDLAGVHRRLENSPALGFHLAVFPAHDLAPATFPGLSGLANLTLFVVDERVALAESRVAEFQLPLDLLVRLTKDQMVPAPWRSSRRSW